METLVKDPGGTGPEIGTAMASHPEIDMVSIAGSNRAGVLVAAPTFNRVTLCLATKHGRVSKNRLQRFL